MCFTNVAGRLTVLSRQDTGTDVAAASRFPADPALVGDQWPALLDWAADLDPARAEPIDVATDRLGNPAPASRQVFAIGLNYADHTAESKFSVPETPTVFNKFPASLTGPYGEIALPAGDVDWEVELVAVIARHAEAVAEERAWDYVAGLSVGQDISERRLQLAGPAPRFSEYYSDMDSIIDDQLGHRRSSKAPRACSTGARHRRRRSCTPKTWPP